MASVALSLKPVTMGLPTAVVAARRLLGAGVAPVCGDGEHCVESEFCDDGYTDARGCANEDCTAPGT